MMKLSDSRLILFAQVIAGILSLMSVTFIASYLGASIFAFCSLTILFLSLGMVLIDFGSCAWAARELASSSITTVTYRLIMQSKARMNLIFVCFLPVILFLEPQIYRGTSILLLYPILSNRYNFIQQFLITKKKVFQAALLLVLERFCWLTIIPLSIYGIQKAFAFGFPIILGLFLHNSIGIHFLKSQDDVTLPSVKYTQRDLFKKSNHFGIIALSGFSSLLDGFFVAMFSSVSDSGNYLVAQRFRNPAAIFFSSVAFRIKPLAAQRDKDQIRKALRNDRNLLSFGVLTNIIFALVLFFFSGNLLGSTYQNVGIIMCLGTLAAIPFGISLLSTSILSSLGKEKFVAVGNFIFIILIFSGISLAAHLRGSLGAVVYNLSLTVIIAIFYLFALKRELDSND